MKFSELAIYFDKIQQNSSRLEITRILAELFNKLTPDEIEKVVYLLQGRVRPAYEGIDFGMAEKTIIKSCLSALNIEKNYFEKEFKKIGDLGKTIEKFKNEIHSFEEGDLEINKVYEIFYRIATVSGTGSQEIKTSLLSQLIRQLDPTSSRFLVRLPTGIIRMGFSDMTVLDAYSFMLSGDKSWRPIIEKYYHVRPELGYIGKLIKQGGINSLKNIGPKVFTPIIMMKAERMSSAREILDQIGACLVEPKFDGFRCITGHTPIYVKSKGYISVKDVNINDEVLTHKGTFEKVLFTNKRLIDKKEKLFKLHPYLGDSIKITEGHPILVFKNNKDEWIPVEQIKTGDELIFPKPNLSEFSKNGYIDKYFNLIDESGYQKKIKINKDFYQFLGFWLGDGFTNEFHNTERVGITFNAKTEKNLAARYKKIIMNLFQISKISEYSHDGGLTLYWRDKPMRLWLSQYFRREWKGKNIPEWFSYISKENFLAFLNGWIESDGAISHGGGYKIVTKERDVAAFAQLLGLRHGVIIGLHKIRVKIKSTNFIGTYYELIIPGTTRYARVLNDRIIIKVLRNEKIKKDPRLNLYNLQVKNNESYCSGLVALHNCQIHKKSNQIEIFSRSLEKVTFMYPDIVEGLKKQVKASEIIIEGEAIGYNPKTKDFLPFQETVQRKRKYDIADKSKEIPLKFFAFELLYKNGKNYINEPFFKRREILEESIITTKNISVDTILIANQEEVVKEGRLEAMFDEAVKKNLEGVLAKKKDGVYKPGAREWNWIKYKKSYSSKINDTIDCLVMGYDYGKGKRTVFGIGAFLVGVLDEEKQNYLTIAKIGTGLTDEEWRELHLKSKIQMTKSKPENYLVDKMMDCDVWVTPSIVVEIRADEITKSPVHTAGYALRFPRLERFRDDKKPEDVTSLIELRSMTSKHLQENYRILNKK